MLTKITNRLFNNKYQYKVVLVCGGASYFRDKDFDQIRQRLALFKFEEHYYKNAGIKNQEELDWTLKLLSCLQNMKDYNVRVEQPFISIYTNTKKDVDRLIKLELGKVKYISIPPSNSTLVENTIISSKIDFDYRITLGKTTREHSAFVDWASSNKKLRLTKSCIKELHKNRSWGGTYFYITGDNNLLMARMHLGEAINRVDRIVKTNP
jgi:hypothetical protein